MKGGQKAAVVVRAREEARRPIPGGTQSGTREKEGCCYTQLTDVFQEQKGIYFFDRGRKFDMKRTRAAQQSRAATAT